MEWRCSVDTSRDTIISPNDKITELGVPLLAQQVNNPNRIHEDTGSIPGLAQQVKDLVLLQAVV